MNRLSAAQSAIGLLLSLSASAVNSGTVEQATIVADPQMQMKAGKVEGCGARLRSVPKELGPKSNMVLDSSFNVYASGLALLKGGAVELAAKKGSQEVTVRNKPIQSFWLKVQSEQATVPSGDKVIPAETKGYLLYGTSLDAALKLFDAVLTDAPITIGMRLHGEPVERIYTGTAEFSKPDAAELTRCMGELAAQIRNDISKDEATPSK
jgi:hypothetical protein